ncbi:hypothetical protein, partial [Streptomyces sp. SID6137]|uniref:hypothetical protein n=1 Tax=Streptomyces sp. SID6137 TaxID=2690319 RepID=UPI001F3A77CB
GGRDGRVRAEAFSSEPHRDDRVMTDRRPLGTGPAIVDAFRTRDTDRRLGAPRGPDAGQPP